jgi:hypothetical protein
MFERIGRLAEKTAEGLSRRSFLTRMGMGAFALATFASRGWAQGQNCVKNGCACNGANPYYNVTTNQCCSDKRCNNCPALCFECVQNGGCCSGNYPYQKIYLTGAKRCCKDANCASCAACAISNCCGSTTSGNSCQAGTLCWSDNMCQNAC